MSDQDWQFPFPMEQGFSGVATQRRPAYGRYAVGQLPVYQQRSAPSSSRSSDVMTTIAVLCIVVVGAALGWLVLKSPYRAATSPAAAAISPRANAPMRAVATTVAFRSPQGHFSVRFAARPETKAFLRSINGVSVRFYVAGDDVSSTAVGLMEVSRPIPSSRLRTATQAGIRGMTGQNDDLVQHGTLSRQHYRGHLAFAARLLSRDGDPFAVLFVRWTATREYLFMAPAGGLFRALKASFKPIA